MKYKVAIWIPVFVEVEVDAQDEDEAINIATQSDDAVLSSYAGNGSNYGLVSSLVSETNLTPGEEPLWDEPFAPKAYIVENAQLTEVRKLLDQAKYVGDAVGVAQFSAELKELREKT